MTKQDIFIASTYDPNTGALAMIKQGGGTEQVTLTRGGTGDYVEGNSSSLQFIENKPELHEVADLTARDTLTPKLRDIAIFTSGRVDVYLGNNLWETIKPETVDMTNFEPLIIPDWSAGSYTKGQVRKYTDNKYYRAKRATNIHPTEVITGSLTCSSLDADSIIADTQTEISTGISLEASAALGIHDDIFYVLDHKDGGAYDCHFRTMVGRELIEASSFSIQASLSGNGTAKDFTIHNGDLYVLDGYSKAVLKFDGLSNVLLATLDVSALGSNFYGVTSKDDNLAMLVDNTIYELDGWSTTVVETTVAATGALYNLEYKCNKYYFLADSDKLAINTSGSVVASELKILVSGWSIREFAIDYVNSQILFNRNGFSVLNALPVSVVTEIVGEAHTDWMEVGPQHIFMDKCPCDCDTQDGLEEEANPPDTEDPEEPIIKTNLDGGDSDDIATFTADAGDSTTVPTKTWNAGYSN